LITIEEDRCNRGDASRLCRQPVLARFSGITPRLEAPCDHVGLFAAAAEQAGLLVTGGYGHSRPHERMFGWFTRRVLDDAPIPVLMTH